MKVTSQIICDIIQNCMGISTDQIWIYNQRRAIPEDERMYITVGVIGVKPYGNNNHVTYDTTTTMTDNISQYMQETISIDVMSYTTEAIERYNEVMGSLASTYSAQTQEALGLKIATIPSTINDVSAVEGATLLYRMSLTLNVLRKYDMLITSGSFYDKFRGATVTNTEN